MFSHVAVVTVVTCCDHGHGRGHDHSHGHGDDCKSWSETFFMAIIVIYWQGTTVD